jgi:hypothetical protein
VRPELNPAHGASLATTAGITAVINLVAAVAMLAQCNALDALGASLAVAAGACFLLAAAALYNARNRVGDALDEAAASSPRASLASARGLLSFHLGMASALGGAGFTSVFRLARPLEGYAWSVPLAATLGVAVCLREAWSWYGELRQRRSRLMERSAS